MVQRERERKGWRRKEEDLFDNLFMQDLVIIDFIHSCHDLQEEEVMEPNRGIITRLLCCRVWSYFSKTGGPSVKIKSKQPAESAEEDLFNRPPSNHPSLIQRRKGIKAERRGGGG